MEALRAPSRPPPPAVLAVTSAAASADGVPRRRGPSLLEVVVVLAAVAVIAMAGLPSLTGSIESARLLDTRREMSRLETAFSAYFEDTLALPASFQDLVADVSDREGWAGPYLAALGPRSVGASLSLIRDAWDAPYHVALHDGHTATLTSRGPDGQLGSPDDCVLNLDMTPILRRETRQRLDLLQAAISAYNARHLPDRPLPREARALVERLIAAGFLPDGVEHLARDAWGTPWRADPPGRDPLVRLSSARLQGP